jgi:hypothetical protein
MKPSASDRLLAMSRDFASDVELGEVLPSSRNPRFAAVTLIVSDMAQALQDEDPFQPCNLKNNRRL